MAEEGIGGHILDFCIPEDDVGDGGFLDLRHYLRRVGTLIPEPIAVSDPLELLSSNGGPEFSEHRARKSDLSQDANVGIDVVHTVETFLNDESIKFVIEDVLEIVQSLQSECNTQGVVISHPMVSIAIGIDGKEIEVSAHDGRRDVSELINIIKGSFFGEGEGESFEDGVDSQVLQGFRIADKQIQEVDLFNGAIVVIDCFVCMRDVGMANSVCRRGEFCGDGWVCAFIVGFEGSDVLIEVGLAEQVRQVVIQTDLLDEANDVVAGCVENLLISKCSIGICCDNQITKTVVFPQEENLKSSQAHILSSSHISSVKLSLFVNRQQ